MEEKRKRRRKKVILIAAQIAGVLGLGAYALHQKARADKLEGQVENLKYSIKGYQKANSIVNYALGKERAINEMSGRSIEDHQVSSSQSENQRW